MSKHGHKNTLFDLTEENVKQGEKNAANAGVVLEGIIQGVIIQGVLELNGLIPNKLYDVVLCMEPMYHPLMDEERRKALKQCLDKLKPMELLLFHLYQHTLP